MYYGTPRVATLTYATPQADVFENATGCCISKHKYATTQADV